MKPSTIATLLLPALLAACGTGIQVHRLSEFRGKSEAPKGVPWNLPMTQYKLTITRQLEGCSMSKDGDTLVGKLKGSVLVAAAPLKSLDPDQQYVLSSTGWWATADITSQLGADGTSVGLSAHSEDQTAAVAGSLISAAAQVAIGGATFGASKAIPLPAPGPLEAMTKPAVPPAASYRCQEKQRTALGEIDAQKKQVDKENQEVSAATDAVAKLTARLQGGSASGADSRALARAVDKLTLNQEALTRDQAALAKTVSVLQVVQQLTWPAKSDVVKDDIAATLPPSVKEKWGEWQDAGAATTRVDADDFDLGLALYVADSTGTWSVPQEKTPTVDITVGVPIRVARIGRLLACSGAKHACPRTLDTDTMLADNIALPAGSDLPVLQLGQIYLIPTTGGTFRSEGTAITLDTNGNPTSIEIYEKASVAAAAASTTATGLGQIVAIPGQVAQAQLAATQAQVNQLTANTQLIQATDNAALAPVTAAAQAKTTLATAQVNLVTAQANAIAAGPQGQLAILNAQANLAAAQANVADQPLVNSLGAQTALVTARANLLKAQLAVMQGKAALVAGPTP